MAAKEKIKYLDLIRAISCVIIVFFHYSYTFYEYAIPGKGTDFLRFTNGDWGGIFVAIFFMISGAALWYNHTGPFGIKGIFNFYKKRALSIYPYFYTAWIIMYVINSRKLGIWDWGGPKSNYLFTLFGMDGYFSYLGQNYYCLGEWFLGAIIWLYLLYPLLAFAFRKFRWPSTAILTFLYVFNLYRNNFSSSPDSNIFIVFIKYYNSHTLISDNMCIWTCMMNFWLGMLFVTYRQKIIKLWIAVLSAVSIVFLTIVPVALPKIIVSTIMAFAFCLIFSYISNRFDFPSEDSIPNTVIKFLSKYSYGIFLVHHVILYAVMEKFRYMTFNRLTAFLLFIPILALISVVGAALIQSVSALLQICSRLLPAKEKAVNK
ncbi:acyltransferase family protein [Lachnospiraceae bacterium C1.1]|nr:acyltransferase [Lachnospiraceae bacterium C1.1]